MQKVVMNKKLGQCIQRLRKEQGITQDEMAAKLQLKGIEITRSTYAKIEIGIRSVSIRELRATKDILDVSWDQMME